MRVQSQPALPPQQLSTPEDKTRAKMEPSDVLLQCCAGGLPPSGASQVSFPCSESLPVGPSSFQARGVLLDQGQLIPDHVAVCFSLHMEYLCALHSTSPSTAVLGGMTAFAVQ